MRLGLFLYEQPLFVVIIENLLFIIFQLKNRLEGGTMLIGNNETTKLIDNYAINNLGIPSIVLMENAAISFMKHIDISQAIAIFA